MDLEQVYYLGELIAAVAVVASLLFVGVQMRQNSNALRVSATAAGVANWQETVLVLASSDYIAPALVRFNAAERPDELGVEDVMRVTAFAGRNRGRRPLLLAVRHVRPQHIHEAPRNSV